MTDIRFQMDTVFFYPLTRITYDYVLAQSIKSASF